MIIFLFYSAIFHWHMQVHVISSLSAFTVSKINHVPHIKMPLGGVLDWKKWLLNL